MSETTTYQSLTDRVRGLIDEVIAGSPLYLVDLAVRGQKGSRVVEVFVDSDEGLSVDELARVSREVGFLLETEDVIDGKYKLDVSSPGVDRPLVLPRQFKKNIGRRLEVQVQPEGGGSKKTLQGELAAADEEGIELALRNKETRRLRYADVTRAKIQLPW